VKSIRKAYLLLFIWFSHLAWFQLDGICHNFLSATEKIEMCRDSIWAASRDDILQRVKQQLTGKSAYFPAFGQVTECTIFLMYPKGQHTTQHCSLML
jgi:hypothetical protein